MEEYFHVAKMLPAITIRMIKNEDPIQLLRLMINFLLTLQFTSRLNIHGMDNHFFESRTNFFGEILIDGNEAKHPVKPHAIQCGSNSLAHSWRKAIIGDAALEFTVNFAHRFNQKWILRKRRENSCGAVS